VVLIPQKHFLLIKLHKSISSLFNLILTFIINKSTTEQCKKQKKKKEFKPGATAPWKKGQRKFSRPIPVQYPSCRSSQPPAFCFAKLARVPARHGAPRTPRSAPDTPNGLGGGARAEFASCFYSPN